MLRHEASVTDKPMLRASADKSKKKIAAKSGTNFNFYTGTALQYLNDARKNLASLILKGTSLIGKCASNIT